MSEILQEIFEIYGTEGVMELMQSFSFSNGNDGTSYRFDGMTIDADDKVMINIVEEEDF